MAATLAAKATPRLAPAAANASAPIATIFGVSFTPRAKLSAAVAAQCPRSAGCSRHVPSDGAHPFADTTTLGQAAAAASPDPSTSASVSPSSTHTQAGDKWAATPYRPYPMPADTSGLTASGRAIVVRSSSHRIVPAPPAVIAAPMMAPVRAWVVETGSPVAEARSTHAAAPIAIASGNAGEASSAGPTSAEVNALTRPTEMISAAPPPTAVHSVPQA